MNPTAAPAQSAPESKPPAAAASPPSDALLIRPPQQARSRRTLDRFLDATRDLLQKGGEGAVTVSEVVDRAGVSVGAFYSRFEGRDDLVRYLGERSLEEALEGWSAEDLSGDIDLRSALVRLAQAFLDGPPRTMVLLDGYHDPSPSRLRRFEDRVARALRLFDPFPSPPREGDLLRALFLVAGIRELTMRALRADGDLPGVPKDPETLASVALSMLPTEDGETEDPDTWIEGSPSRRFGRADRRGPESPPRQPEPEPEPPEESPRESHEAELETEERPEPDTKDKGPEEPRVDVDPFDVWG